ncbi:TspO/MBR family protein [Sphaerotilus mobilis]|uniref:TspO/MBR related protein n=1 Tax=Sphaerotilus mobilis TaxID=47994 RepID=A0A4Q7LU11_9BURK|nr:TspO/MBR family protein [Sphaerotilus mobilis]RZS58546.1 TspO/MBR related protein [Sphaerotilus mobilis]
MLAGLGAVALAGLGGLATDLGPWYAALRQPAWKPPDLWFGPAWTLIFTLAAWSAVLGWQAAAPGAPRRRWLLALGLNAALNLGWSLLFFTLKRPDWALAEVALLALSVAGLIRAAPTWRAGVLLAPYLAWVLYASSINAGVVWLNR